MLSAGRAPERQAGDAPRPCGCTLGTPMNTSFLMTLEFALAPANKIGPVPCGTRTIVPIVGGSFEGPRLSGKVLPGGGDWTLLRGDGVLELDIRVTLETDDSAAIYMTATGLRHGPPDVISAITRGERVDPASYYFRALPRFETGSEKYAFLNRMLVIATGDRRPAGPVYAIHEIV
jgi:hypothetical protein